MNEQDAWNYLCQLDSSSFQEECLRIHTVLLNGPIKAKLRDRIFCTDLVEKEAYLAELRQYLKEVPNYMSHALEHGWRPSVAKDAGEYRRTNAPVHQRSES